MLSALIFTLCVSSLSAKFVYAPHDYSARNNFTDSNIQFAPFDNGIFSAASVKVNTANRPPDAPSGIHFQFVNKCPYTILPQLEGGKNSFGPIDALGPGQKSRYIPMPIKIGGRAWAKARCKFIKKTKQWDCAVGHIPSMGHTWFEYYIGENGGIS